MFNCICIYKYLISNYLEIQPNIKYYLIAYFGCHNSEYVRWVSVGCPLGVRWVSVGWLNLGLDQPKDQKQFKVSSHLTKVNIEGRIRPGITELDPEDRIIPNFVLGINSPNSVSKYLHLQIVRPKLFVFRNSR